jgi:hypothetical protein
MIYYKFFSYNIYNTYTYQLFFLTVLRGYRMSRFINIHSEQRQLKSILHTAKISIRLELQYISFKIFPNKTIYVG